MLGWFTDKSTYRQWVWLCAPSYEHKTIWRLEKWGKGAVKFTVLLMWQILDVILWFNISLIWPAWTKTTHPLQLGNLLWMMKRNPLEKKNPGLKYSSREKKSLQYPQTLSYWTPQKYHLEFILMHSLLYNSSQACTTGGKGTQQNLGLSTIHHEVYF